MRRQENPQDRLDALRRIDLFDPNRAEFDRRRQPFDLIAPARPRDFDLSPAHAGLRDAGGLACLRGDGDLPPLDMGRRRHRREQLGTAAQDAVVIGAPEQMDVSRAGRGVFLIDVALAIIDEGHHRRFLQREVRRPQTPDPAPGFLGLDRARAPALGLSLLAPARRRLLATVDVGVREPDDAARMAHLPRIAVARVHHDHRMQKKPDVAAVADHAEASLAPLVPGEIELRRVLDRQYVPPPRRNGRMIGGGREHDLARYRLVVQKAPIALRRRPVAAEPPQASRALGRERRQKICPLFLSRSSPNCPKSVMPCIARPSANHSSGRTESENHKNSEKKEVCID